MKRKNYYNKNNTVAFKGKNPVCCKIIFQTQLQNIFHASDIDDVIAFIKHIAMQMANTSISRNIFDTKCGIRKESINAT
jgi:hypothetical protein